MKRRSFSVTALRCSLVPGRVTKPPFIEVLWFLDWCSQWRVRFGLLEAVGAFVVVYTARMWNRGAHRSSEVRRFFLYRCADDLLMVRHRGRIRPTGILLFSGRLPKLIIAGSWSVYDMMSRGDASLMK